MIALLLLFLLAPRAAAQSEAPSPYTPMVPAVEALSELDELKDPVVQNVASQVFFDSNKTGFSDDLKRQLLEGDVVLIGGGTLVAADKVQLDRGTNVVEARGHLVILNKAQLFLGDSVVYHLATGDFEIRDAVMLTNDAAEIERVTRRIFGFTAKEVEFETQRQRRLGEIQELKSRLRREARRQVNAGSPLNPDLVNRYTLLLEQENLVAAQENPSLARFPSERRESLKRRRDFWDKSRANGSQAAKGNLSALYFHIEGERITRSNGNDYVARNALFTPCRCEEGEKPAWAFRADDIEAQVGGYADLSHPVLEIKGIPVLYLPHLKLPLKDRRQSGFLPPTFGYQPRSGNIYTQPVYFDLGPSSDATFTTDVFEKRGTRLGVEYRTQQKELSGWEIAVEGMRDRLWMEDRGVREELGNLYRDGLSYAATPSNPAVDKPSEELTGRAFTEEYLKSRQYWNEVLASNGRKGGVEDPANVEFLQDAINQHLAVPENTWRGAYNWRGVSFFAPRLSLVSNGEVASDHRYSEELYVPDDFQEAFFGGSRVKPFSTGNAQLHLDGKDFYAGLGTRFGDNYLLDERFQGQQEPVRFKLQSRYYPLVPPGSPLQVYGQLTTENIRVTEFKASSEEEDAANTPTTLGDGNWKRVKLDTVTPIVSDAIVQVNQFNALEARYIDHAGLSDHRSEIRSWLTGIEFRLPIDGKGQLPDWMGDAACEGDQPSPDCVDPDDTEAPKKFAHHIMDWRLRFATRPAVVRTGPYADPYADPTDPLAGRLAYFASDVPISTDAKVAALDGDVAEEDRMQLTRRVTLFTDNVWKLLRRGWEKIPAAAPPAPQRSTAANDPGERARRELLYEVDRPVGDSADLYDEANKKWLVDRYQLDDEYYATPLTFRADAGYDFLDAQKREQIRKENAEAPAEERRSLPTAWKPVNAELGIYHAGFSLLTSVSYDVYLKQALRLSETLTTPSIFETNLQLGYSVDGSYNDVEQRITRLYERRFRLATSLVGPVTTYLSVKRRDQEGQRATYTNRFEVAEGIDYTSTSDCWGLQFLRRKDYEKEERQAVYLLQLSVVFMGQKRNLPDMSPAAVRDTTGNQPEKS